MESLDVWYFILDPVHRNYINNMQNAVVGVTFDKKAAISRIKWIVCCENKQNRCCCFLRGNKSTEQLYIAHSDICETLESLLSSFC